MGFFLGKKKFFFWFGIKINKLFSPPFASTGKHLHVSFVLWSKAITVSCLEVLKDDLMVHPNKADLYYTVNEDPGMIRLDYLKPIRIQYILALLG